MAAVPVTINGVLIDYLGRTIMGPLKIVGEMVRTDVGVGGGPMPPGEGGVGDAHPEHPIYYPPGIWGPTDPRPTPPIVIPKPPEGFPQPPEGGAGKPPPSDGGWGYHPDYGWGYFPGTGGLPSPKG